MIDLILGVVITMGWFLFPLSFVKGYTLLFGKSNEEKSNERIRKLSDEYSRNPITSDRIYEAFSQSSPEIMASRLGMLVYITLLISVSVFDLI